MHENKGEEPDEAGDALGKKEKKRNPLSNGCAAFFECELGGGRKGPAGGGKGPH